MRNLYDSILMNKFIDSKYPFISFKDSGMINSLLKLSGNKKAFENLLIFLFLLTLPFQLGKHFFFDFSYLNGIRVDYLAPTIYLTDMLATIMIIFNFKLILPVLKNRVTPIILLLILLNITFSRSPELAIYWNLKIVELTAIYIVFSQKKINSVIWLWSFFLSTLLVTVLAFWQFIAKHSVDGIFYFLGERHFTLSTPGIAKASLNGVEMLRPYATFSHPNSMAGFYLLLYFFILSSNRFFRSLILRSILMLLTSLFIFISFSKTAIIAFILLNIVYVFRNNLKNICRPCILSKTTIMLVTALIFLPAKTDPLDISKRIDLINNASLIILTHPVFGTGAGNYLLFQNGFASRYFDLINQPVHNIFLLFLSEYGMGGVFIFIVLKDYLKKLLTKKNLLILGAIAITGFFDHYWLTLQQNMLLAAIILGSTMKREQVEKLPPSKS